MPDENVEKKLQKFVEEQEDTPNQTQNNPPVGSKMSEAPAPKLPFQRNENQISQGNQIGWQKLPIKDLPTKGLFYPEGTEVSIRAASAGEIRHWSTLQEDDPYSLDDMLNYVLERCVSFKSGPTSSWRDIKEIDRFYILLAIREYTFVKGENQLQVKVDEGKNVNVTKEMVDFIQIDDRLMKYYDPEKRCFLLKFKSGGTIEVTIPNVGVTNFLKGYISRKQSSGQGFDTDFITFAPFVIKDWRGLNDSVYEKMVMDSYNWTMQEVSVLAHIKDIFVETVDPVIKYTDEGGAERVAPLNFRGGIKSLFLVSDPFGELV
jgi:hypothetical protein